jgi:hypothetical protein
MDTEPGHPTAGAGGAVSAPGQGSTARLSAWVGDGSSDEGEREDGYVNKARAKS